ncbi:MAG: NAD(P)H-dependent oxidoreductase [Planctomycetaceae bacterium]|nr:NAD(P)H-dependent oxidoreductase [Planctomycetaceae bacterium]
MTVLTPEDLLTQLRWRYAVKKFDATRRVSETDWQALEEALVLTPSSFGLQPWRFYVITSQEIRDQLPAISWNQSQVRDASHVVVFAIRSPFTDEDVDRFVVRTAEVRETPVEKLAGFRNLMVKAIDQIARAGQIEAWATFQVYIALGNFMTAAAALGIDTCPMEGILPDRYDELLGLREAGYRTVVVATAGYRAPDDKYALLAKVRYPTDEMIVRL